MNDNRKSAKEFFDSRAKSFHRVSKWALNEELNRMSDDFLKDLTGNVALELGAGSGILITRLKNFKRRIALDISRNMLSLIEDAAVEKIVGDIHHLSLPNEFADLIICRQVLHYCDLDLAFQNIKRVLKKNGFLHIVQVIDFENVPSEWDYKWASFRGVNNRKHLRVKDLETAFESHLFEIEKSSRLLLNERYSWSEFFLKHNIDRLRENEVKSFFLETPAFIAKEIKLTLDESGISYNRNFGLWLLKLQS